MNPTDPLTDLLAVLVANHQAKNGAQFYLTRNAEGWGITYPGGPSFSVRYDHLDALHGQQLVRLERSGNCYRGWPTQLVITDIQARRRDVEKLAEPFPADGRAHDVDITEIQRTLLLWLLILDQVNAGRRSQ